jgi:hypothetical protein
MALRTSAKIVTSHSRRPADCTSRSMAPLGHAVIRCDQVAGRAILRDFWHAAHLCGAATRPAADRRPCARNRRRRRAAARGRYCNAARRVATTRRRPPPGEMTWMRSRGTPQSSTNERAAHSDHGTIAAQRRSAPPPTAERTRNRRRLGVTYWTASLTMCLTISWFPRRTMNRASDALLCATAAQVAGEGCVDVVGGGWIGREEREERYAIAR